MTVCFLKNKPFYEYCFTVFKGSVHIFWPEEQGRISQTQPWRAMSQSYAETFGFSLMCLCVRVCVSVIESYLYLPAFGLEKGAAST